MNNPSRDGLRYRAVAYSRIQMRIQMSGIATKLGSTGLKAVALATTIFRRNASPRRFVPQLSQALGELCVTTVHMRDDSSRSPPLLRPKAIDYNAWLTSSNSASGICYTRNVDFSLRLLAHRFSRSLLAACIPLCYSCRSIFLTK